MPTTNPGLAAELLDLLTEHDINFALAHQRADLSDVGSDLDIVASVPAADIARRLAHYLNSHPVMIWPYESGSSANLFLVDSALDDGAQIDILCDPAGKGRLGLRSHVLLEHKDITGKYPTLTPAMRSLYLIRKRWVKNQAGRLRRLIGGADLPDARLLAEVATDRAARSVLAALAGESPRRPTPAPTSALRVLKRVREPVGYWVHVSGEQAPEVAEDIHGKAARVFPHHGRSRLPASRIPLWRIRQVEPIRMRAGVYVTWGGETGLSKPDIIIDSASGSPEVVRQMKLRTLSRL